MWPAWYVGALLLVPEHVIAYSREADGRTMAVDSRGAGHLMRSHSAGTVTAANPYTKQKGVDGPPGAPNDIVTMGMPGFAPAPATGHATKLSPARLSGLISAATMVVCGLLSALLYRYIKAWPKASSETADLTKWSSDYFGCFSDLPSCCWACWCPCIRWGDTMDMTSIIAFWPATLAFLFLVSSTAIPLPFCSLMLVVLMTYGRQRLRKSFEMQHGDCKSVCGDCLFVTFCTPCAISQEARHAEKAAQVNHPLVAAKRPLEGGSPPSYPGGAAAAAPAQGEMSPPEATQVPSTTAPPPAAAPKKEAQPAQKDADSDEEF